MASAGELATSGCDGEVAGVGDSGRRMVADEPKKPPGAWLSEEENAGDDDPVELAVGRPPVLDGLAG